MNRLLTLFLLIPFVYAAQTISNRMNPGQEIYKANHWCGSLNAATHATRDSWNHGPEAVFTGALNNDWTLSAQSFLSIGKLDHARSGVARESHTDGQVKLLPYSQTAFTAIRRLNFLNRSPENRKMRRLPTVFEWGVRFGYFHSQESLYSYNGGREYYQLYATPEGNAGFISGYRVNTGTIGLDYSKTVSTKRSTRMHHIYTDLLIGFNLSFSAYQKNADGSYSDIVIKEHFTRDRYGARIGYEYKWFGKKGVGFLLGVESQLKPNIEYRYNHDLYWLRGGERFSPYALIAKVGLAYRF